MSQKSRILHFLFPIPSLILYILIGLILVFVKVDGNNMSLNLWFFYMILFFICLIIPFDVLWWIIKRIYAFFSNNNKFVSKILIHLNYNLNKDREFHRNNECSDLNANTIINNLYTVFSDKISEKKIQQSASEKSSLIEDCTYKSLKLVDEMQLLIKIINSTIDETQFDNCFVRLREIFEELCNYEPYITFEGSPKKELQMLNNKKQSAYYELLNRKKNSSLHGNNSIAVLSCLDTLFADAGRCLIEKNNASIYVLQKKFKINFSRAAIIMEQLYEFGVISEEFDDKSRKILMSKTQFELLICQLNSEITKRKEYNENQSKKNITNIDNMTGHEFEYFCANILKKNGFTNVEVTQESGDHGIDILAEKDDITYAIQCKCYSSSIGNAAIQQAHTGKSLYHKDVAVVMTNQHFTSQANEEAIQLGVKLWDRNKLNDFIEKAKD